MITRQSRMARQASGFGDKYDDSIIRKRMPSLSKFQESCEIYDECCVLTNHAFWIDLMRLIDSDVQEQHRSMSVPLHVVVFREAW